MAINKMIETALGRFQISTNISDDGPLVVFLSGAGQFDTLATYHNVITQLPASVNWLTVDYLNTGYSGTAVKDYTLTDEARAIADIIHTQAAAGVILVAHSLGGVYALVMAEQLKNVAGFVGIELTTREIVLNPPQTAPYQQAAAAQANWTQDQMEAWLRGHSQREFPDEAAQRLWQSYTHSIVRLKPVDIQRLTQAMNSFSWSRTSLTLPVTIPTVIVTEAHRAAEMARSEYMTANPRSRVIAGGSYHYIHWEQPTLVSQAIMDLVPV
ncbi:alpha/beta hydrolase [Schleiferilactobacillus harbinensis]|uniref:alpha/beta fold hydrolase n=1 Tax=Schleiferilactobacillus harbinensis TaxID=304207 RepID=UPI001AAFA919|nr:alpha/beta hydrolase [Schleiferilactobacillus harbinensis]MBO3091128.1 alpha/beta hydrolase [Schleiferilactobacillus harbinensis]